MKGRMCLALAALASVAPACLSHVQRADEWVAAGKPDEARAVLDAALLQDPADAQARFALARLHAQQERWVEAETALRVVLDANPSHRKGRELLAEVLLAVGSDAQAAFQLGRIREIHGRDAIPDDRFRTVLLDAAQSLLSAGEYAGGIRLVERAIEEGLVPYEQHRGRLSAAWSARAAHLVSDGLRDAAVDAWAAAQRHDPHNAQHPLQRGRLLAEMNRFIDARKAFDDHIRRTADSPTGQAAAAHRVGRWFEKRGVPSTAAEYFEEALRLDGTRAESVIAVARQRLELRDLRRARTAFADYVRLAGDRAPTWRRIGEEARAQGARRLAEEYLGKAGQLDPGDIVAAKALAGLLSARGARDEARSVMSRYADSRKDPGAASFTVAEWAAGQDDSDFAITHYELSTKAHPDRTVTLLRLYELYREAGRTSDAERALERYVQAATDKPAAHATVADRLRIERRYGPAASQLRKALKLRPDDVGFWSALARVYRDARRPDDEEQARLELIRRAKAPGVTLLAVGNDYKRREDWPRALKFFEMAAGRADLPTARRQDALYLLGEVRWKTRDRPGMRAADQRFVELAEGPDGRARALARLEARYRGASLMEDQRWALLEQIRIQPERPELHLRLGTLQLRHGDRDSADAAFRKYVARSDDKVRALHAVATRYRRNNDYDAALAAYRRIREVAPGDPRYLQYTADIYRSRGAPGDDERAAKLYDELLSSHAADKLDLGKLGHQLFLGHYYAQSARAYERLLGRSSLRGAYGLELGICLLKLGKSERAREVFNQWLEGEGGGARPQLEVARKYREERLYDDALRHYGRVLAEAGPELDQAYGEAAEVMAAQGDRSGLLEVTRAYLAQVRSGNEVRAHALAADKLARGGLREEAVEEWRKVLALRPNRAEALQHLTDLLYSLGRADEAATYVARLIEEAGNNPRSWLEAAKGLRARGAFVQALEFYGRGLSAETDRSEIQLARGEVYLALGRWGEAADAFGDALASATGKRAPLERIGALLERYDRQADAVAHWIRATTLDPSHPAHHARLIRAYLRQGLDGKARRALLAARAHAPGGMTAIADRFLDAGHVSFAAQLYEEVLEAGVEQHLKDAFVRLAGIRLARGQAEALGPAVQRFVTTARNRPQAQRVVAKAFADAGLFDAAYGYASLAKREAPQDDEILSATASYALAAGRDEEALDAIVDRIERHAQPTEAAGEVLADLVGRGRADLTDRLLVRLEVALAGNDGPSLEISRLRMASGDLPGAMRSARQHLAEAAEPDEARRGLAREMFSRGFEHEATELLGQAAEADDAQPDILVDLAEMLFEQGDSAGGRAALERWRAAKAESERPEQLALLTGAVLHGAGEWEEAATHLLEATRHSKREQAERALHWRLVALGAAGHGAQTLRAAIADYIGARPDRNRAYQGAVAALFKQHRLELAAEIVRQGLERFPGDPKLVEYQVVVQLRRGDPAATQEAVRQLLGLKGSDLDQRLAELATRFERELRWDEASELRRQLLELAPGARSVMLAAARADLLAGRQEIARELIDSYVADAEAPASAAQASAGVLLAGGAPGPAREFAVLATKSAPDDAPGWLLRAVTALRLGERDEEAERAYVAKAADPDRARIFLARRLLFSGRAPRLGSPTPPKAWGNEALTLLTAADPAGRAPEPRLWSLLAQVGLGADGAAVALAEALRRLPARFLPDPLDLRSDNDPDPPPFVAALAADVLMREGALDEADEALRLWVGRSLKPKDVLHQGAFELARTRRSGVLMRRWLDELDRRFPDHSAKVTLLAEALEASGDEDGAEATYRQALARSPRAGVYMNNLAYLFSRRRRGLQEGLDLVRRAERIQPQSNKFYFDTEGWVLYRMGRLKEARERILASIRLMNAGMGPTVSESYFHLGSVSRDLGMVDEARRAFHAARVLDPWGEYGVRSQEALDQLDGRVLERATTGE